MENYKLKGIIYSLIGKIEGMMAQNELDKKAGNELTYSPTQIMSTADELEHYSKK